MAAPLRCKKLSFVVSHCWSACSKSSAEAPPNSRMQRTRGRSTIRVAWRCAGPGGSKCTGLPLEV